MQITGKIIFTPFLFFRFHTVCTVFANESFSGHVCLPHICDIKQILTKGIIFKPFAASLELQVKHLSNKNDADHFQYVSFSAWLPRHSDKYAGHAPSLTAFTYTQVTFTLTADTYAHGLVQPGHFECCAAARFCFRFQRVFT